MVKDKEKVIIYTLYDEVYLNRSYEEEQMLRKYCEDKKYEVIEIVREPQIFDYFETLNNIMSILNNRTDYNSLIEDKRIFKIIIFNIENICRDENSIITLSTILKTKGVSIETIMQGVIGKDLKFDSIVKIDVDNKVEKNKKYFIKDEPFN